MVKVETVERMRQLRQLRDGTVETVMKVDTVGLKQFSGVETVVK